MKNDDNHVIQEFIKEVLSEASKNNSYLPQTSSVIDPEVARLLDKVEDIVTSVRSVEGQPNKDIQESIESLVSELTEAQSWMKKHNHPMYGGMSSIVQVLTQLKERSSFLSRPLFFKRGEYQEKNLSLVRELERLVNSYQRRINHLRAVSYG